MKKVLFFSVVVLASIGSVNADPLYCNGKIVNTYIDATGSVNIKGTWANVWRKICNANDPEVVTCSLWTSYVASAVQNNQDVTVKYFADSGITCETLPTYNNAPKPSYIMVHNPNQ